jgi:hypothetical protein
VLLAIAAIASPLIAQDAVARMPVSDANVKGKVEIKSGQMEMSSGVEVNAGAHAAEIQLARGGKVTVCPFSGIHISRGTNASEVMLALDHGAMEVHGSMGDFSDVLMTADMRLLLSGPGTEDVSLRVNGQGDTCVNNAGSKAPYVTATEQLGSGLYRVQAGQHVMFEHGSVGAVVDAEKEPCGCPPVPVVSVADAGTSSTTAAKPGAAIGAGAASANKPAFPLAESEGLAPPEKPSTVPAVPPGQVHAEVTIPFRYDGSQSPTPAAPAAGNAAASSTGSGNAPVTATVPATAPTAAPSTDAAATPQTATPTMTPVTSTTATATTTAAPPPPKKPEQTGGWHAIGRFFKRLFGG